MACSPTRSMQNPCQKSKPACKNRPQPKSNADSHLKTGARNKTGEIFETQTGKCAFGHLRQSAGGVNQRVWMLINKGRVFRDMLSHAGVRNIVDHALGHDYLLSSHSANIAKPGGVAMRLHTDQWWMPAPTRPHRAHLPVGSITREQTDEPNASFISPCVVVNVVWMIGAFTSENGGTPRRAAQSPLGTPPRSSRSQRGRETVALEGPARHGWVSRRTNMARHRGQCERSIALGHSHHILRPSVPPTRKTSPWARRPKSSPTPRPTCSRCSASRCGMRMAASKAQPWHLSTPANNHSANCDHR